MNNSLLKMLCCPKCKSNLILTHIDTVLKCFICGKIYVIENGLPIILEEPQAKNITAYSFGEQWDMQAKGKFEKESIYGIKKSEELSEFLNTFNIQNPSDLIGKIILDAGCGSGRLTRSLGEYAPKATIVGIDISGSANIAYNRCKNLKNTYILRTDLLRPPFKNDLFDYVWSEGVIHHTENSKKSFAKLADMVVQGGMLYVWVYPSYIYTPYRLARKILIFSYLYPTLFRYLISFVLAYPTFVLYKLLNGIKVFKNVYSLNAIAFKYFDSLSPQYQFYFSKKEVISWFKNKGFRKVCVKENLGVVGVKN